MAVQLKKIFPMRVNFEIRNFKQKLKKKNLELSANTDKRRIFLLDAASYSNLGDQAIVMAMSQFITDNFPEYEYVEVSESELLRNMRYLKKNVRPDDIICLSGGGNMGNLYPKYESIRRMVIKSFPDNKVIIFPQTIDYENDSYGQREMKNSSKIYNRHKKLVVCAREKKSYAQMQQLYKNVLLVPDIVLYLYGRLDLNAEKNSNAVGICLRRDKESVTNGEQKKYIADLCMAGGYEVKRLSTISNIGYINNKNRRVVVLDKLNEFRQCSFIITDRLHGMIFSILTDVPCLAIDNSNRKVSGVFGLVGDRVKNVKVINAEQICELTDFFRPETGKMFDGADLYRQLCKEIVNN